MLVLVAAAAAVGGAACRNADERLPPTTTASAVSTSPGAEAPRRTVDSTIPIPEALRRFKEGLTEVSALSNAAPSRDELVRRFTRAVERNDSVALAKLALTRGEFAYLYYPSTRYTQRPYELDPALLWLLTQQNSGKGFSRLLGRLGGHPLHSVGYRCAETPVQEGANVLWERCRVMVAGAAGDTIERRLFGTIVERDGRFKLISFANEF